MTAIELRWGLRSDVGQVRQANQDSAMANGTLFVVADGMGGHRGGEVASEIAKLHFETVASVDDAADLAEQVIKANQLIRSRAADDPNLSGMGTTIVALAVLTDDRETMELACANVGDSRMYRLFGDDFHQMTFDHSLVAELTRAGQLTEEQAARHPQRNVLTRALGVDSDVMVDHWVFPAAAGQRYVLCSDGLVNEVDDSAIEAALREIDDPDGVADTLVRLANEAGGRDNVTVLVVDVVETTECDPDATQS